MLPFTSFGEGEVWGVGRFGEGEVWGGVLFGEVCCLGRFAKCGVVILTLVLTLGVVLT